MPNHHCCVPGCAADSRKNTSLDKYRFLRGVTFHPFPRDPAERTLWLELIRRPDDYVPNRYSRVCSLHFEGGKGPTPDHPCPTIFLHNNHKGIVPQELGDKVRQASLRAKQQEALRTTPTTQVVRTTRPVPPLTNAAEAARKKSKQEQLSRMQADLLAKAQANAAILASINEAEKAGQIQLIDEADIKAIQDAAEAGEAEAEVIKTDTEMLNPYRFINENTDLMWQLGTLPTTGARGQTSSSSAAAALPTDGGMIVRPAKGGGWEVAPATSKTATSAAAAAATTVAEKRKAEEPESAATKSSEEEEEDDDEDDDEEDGSDEEEEDGQKKEGKASKATEKDVKKANGPDDTEGLATYEPEPSELLLQPPLYNEPPDVALMRERLTLRGPHHNYLPKPRCKFCNLFFQSIESLLGHLYRHTDRPYQCVECGGTFRKAAELENHLDCHGHRDMEFDFYYRVSGSKTGVLRCPVEGCVWHTWNGLRQFTAHIRMHNKECCILCGEGLHGASEPHFIRHIKKHMPWNMRLKCPMCPTDKQVYHRKQLESHVKSDHGIGLKPWACYHCDNHKIIPRFCDLDLHLLKHHSSNPYECQYCGAAYPSIYGLRCHARKHHKRGKEHDTKYEWVEVVHGQKARQEAPLSSVRKSHVRQKVTMLPQTGDRLIQPQVGPMMVGSPSKTNLMTTKLGTPPGNMSISAVAAAAAKAASLPAAALPSPTLVTPPKSQQKGQVVVKKYKPQKVCIMQKDGTFMTKTLLLPVDEAAQSQQPPQLQLPAQAPAAKSASQVSATQSKGAVHTTKQASPATKRESSPLEQVSLADIASGQISGVELDGSILESLGISSQDLELGQVTDTDQSLGFTITEVRGDIDFGALPDDGINGNGKESGATGNPATSAASSTPSADVTNAVTKSAMVAPPLLEDEDDKASTKVVCPYVSCSESFDTVIGFWRRHYLQLHFKRSDLYEFMCRSCGALFANWDWPPERHPCERPRWASICADCGDIFENQRHKNAHFPDCPTFQKYTPTRPATVVITAHTCLYCHTTLKSVADLCSHLRESHVSRRFNSLALFCSLCEDYPSFARPDGLWAHYRSAHTSWWKKQPPWLCSKCGEAHESEYDLSKHVVYTHAQDVPANYLCSKCPYVFAEKNLFVMHQQIAHKDEEGAKDEEEPVKEESKDVAKEPERKKRRK